MAGHHSMRFTAAPFVRRISYANPRRSPYLRRRPPRPGLLGSSPPGSRPGDARHPPHPAQPPPALGRHGHGHRGPPRHHHRPGRRHRHRSQEHDHRGAGARGRPREEIRERHHQGPDHRLPQYEHPRSARAHALARHLRRAGGRRQEGRRHRHAPRPAIRDRSSMRRSPRS